MQDETMAMTISIMQGLKFCAQQHLKVWFRNMNVCKIVIRNILSDKSFIFYEFLIIQCLKNCCMQLQVRSHQ